MVTDHFGALLQELAQALNISKLQADANNSCLIKFKGGIRIQIEPDREEKFLIIGADLGEIPTGRYRENLFTEALKANGLPRPRYGFFAYSKPKDHLVLTEFLPMQDLRGDKIADFLPLFIEKVKLWKESIYRGEIPPSAVVTSRPMGMFGMRP